jgi:ferrous iron transport protein B
MSPGRLWSRLDSLALDRRLGIPLFLAVMYLTFVLTIDLGGALAAQVDAVAGVVLVEGFGALLAQWGVSPWLRLVLADGVGGGLQVVAGFVPLIACLFLCLAVLEQSGYMARGAYVMDRFMRALGLPGQAFVPLVVGFGCNVPAVLAARDLEHPRDRRLTMLITPFMSCGARLPVYTLLAASFFPATGGAVVFALYLTGIAAAMLTVFVLGRTLLPARPRPVVSSLPDYRRPALGAVLGTTWRRSSDFALHAGLLIVPLVLALTVLSSVDLQWHLADDAGAGTLLSVLGHQIAPLFTPLGLTAADWPAAVGILTGILAKEAVVATLVSLDATAGFAGAPGAFAYMVFILLYLPCSATLGALYRASGLAWAGFVALWTTGTAFAIATLVYQAATLPLHPVSSVAWIASVASATLLAVTSLRWYARARPSVEFASTEADARLGTPGGCETTCMSCPSGEPCLRRLDAEAASTCASQAPRSD